MSSFRRTAVFIANVSSPYISLARTTALNTSTLRATELSEVFRNGCSLFSVIMQSAILVFTSFPGSALSFRLQPRYCIFFSCGGTGVPSAKKTEGPGRSINIHTFSC